MNFTNFSDSDEIRTHDLRVICPPLYQLCHRGLLSVYAFSIDDRLRIDDIGLEHDLQVPCKNISQAKLNLLNAFKVEVVCRIIVPTHSGRFGCFLY